MKHFWLFIFFISCIEKPELKHGFPYKLEAPEERFVLPDVLKEVSGLTWVDSVTIACIEDNFGDIYLYDLKSKNLKRSFQFEGPGDFEDITNVQNSYYILRSDGVIFQTDTAGQKTERFDTFLKNKNNAEGLCYDSVNNQLLIALKGKPVNGKEDRKQVLIFELSSEKLLKEPLFEIKLKQFEPYLGDLSEKLRFKPSAINIHPLSGDIYILSSTAGALVKVSFDGEIKDMAWLSKDLFPQPEGICFGPEGTMYISNEGQERQPDILKFKYYSE